MAKGKKTGGRDFKPGHSVRRPRLTAESKAIKQALIDELHKVAEVLTMPLNEAYAELQDQENSLLHYILGNAIKKGNDRLILAFLDRTIGKPKEADIGKNEDATITLNYNLDKTPQEYRDDFSRRKNADDEGKQLGPTKEDGVE